MQTVPLRWCGALLTLLLLIPVWSAPPEKPNPLDWHTEEIDLPATPLTVPLPWVKPPSGPGEFLLGFRTDAAGTAPEHRLFGTTGGVVSLEKDGSMRLVPAAFGLPSMIVGRYDGCRWVQQGNGDLIGLDPGTLVEKERVHGLAGPCFALDHETIWCYDSMELATEGLAHGVMNRAPFASAIIEYSRQGKERRRFIADGNSLPKIEISRAIVDPEAIWVIGQPCLAIICSCGAKHYGETQLLRIDRATGKYQVIESAEGINAGVLSLPDRFVWEVDGERQSSDRTGATSKICLLDKHTYKLTQPATIPQKYAHTMLAMQDGKIWCMNTERQDVFDQKPVVNIAVFSLEGGKRLHVEDAGTLPADLATATGDSEEYSVIGSTTDRAWVMGPGNRLYEIPDAGTPLVRDCTAVGTVSRLVTGGAGLATAFLGNLGERGSHGTFLKILPGEPKATRCEIRDTVFPFEMSDRRLWCTAMYDAITCGADLKPKKIPVPAQVSDSFVGYPSVAVGDDLYGFGGGEVVRVDGKSGQAIPIKSWQTQVPTIWQQVDKAGAAFVAPDGRIVFNLTVSGEEGKTSAKDPERRTVLAAYDSATDKWTVTPSDTIKWWGDTLTTPRGAFHVPHGENTLYRGTATAWVAVGKLPCCMDAFRFGAGTAQYLYLDTPLGLYRVQWDALLGKGEAHAQ